MFRSSALLVAIAFSILFLAHQCRGVRFRPTTQEENDALAQHLVRSQAKGNLTSLKSNSIPTTISEQGDRDAVDSIFFATHHTRSETSDDKYYGLLATADVYNHDLKSGQWVSTAIWVFHDGDGSPLSHNSIHVGWQIYPKLYGDSRTHFYTYWTRDGSNKTGCFNMKCPGFVPAAGAVLQPGAVIDPVSDAKGGVLQNITFKVFKDRTSGDWWIYYGFNSFPKAVGYYPKSLFTTMEESARRISFGSFAAAAVTLPTPPMGSGVPPNGGQGRAASFSYVSLVDKDGKSNPITGDLPSREDNGKCYPITPMVHDECFYGGPGGCK